MDSAGFLEIHRIKILISCVPLNQAEPLHLLDIFPLRCKQVRQLRSTAREFTAAQQCSLLDYRKMSLCHP